MKFSHFMSAAAVVVCSTTVVQAETWRMATAYPETNFHTLNIQQFVQDINAATDGQLAITVHSNGSLIRPSEIKNSVRSRQVEAGEFLLSALANENTLFAADAVPFMAVSHEDSEKLYQVTKPYLEEVLGRQNMKLLYAVAWPPQGMYTDRPINTIEDLKGLRMRAYSPQTERLAQLSGAVPTQIEAADLAQAFTTGRVNAMITSASTGVNSTAWDYLSHYYDVAAFLPKNVVVVNQRSFDALDEATQNAILEAAAKAEQRGWELSRADRIKQTQALADNGIEVSEGSEELRAALREIGTQMAQEWSKEAGQQGVAILEAFNQ